MALLNRFILTLGRVVSGRQGCGMRCGLGLVLFIAIGQIAYGQCPESLGYAYEKTITIRNASGTQNLIYFPVLLKIPSSAFNGHLLSAEGYDVIFTDESYTRLDHQIDQILDAGNDTLIVWVKIPILNCSTSTTIKMLYGKTGATDPSVKSTWSPDYKAVWHLDNYLNATAVSLNDGANHQTTDIAGIIGKGKEFDGTNGYIQTGVNEFNNPNQNQSISIWAKYTAVPGGNENFICITNSSSSAVQVGFRGGKPAVWMNGGVVLISSSVVPSVNAWHYYTYVYDETAHKHFFYIDGTEVGSSGTTPQSGAVTIANIGRWTGGEYFNGSLDEIRVSTSVKSADWVKTEYTNQNKPGSFYSIGPEAYDDQKPSVSCPGNQSRNTDNDRNYYTVAGNEFDASAADNCAVTSLTNNFNGLATLNGAHVPIGTTNVVWTATDKRGNTNTCSFDVIVTDNQKPVAISKPVTLRLDINSGNATIMPADIDGGCTDNDGIKTLIINKSSFFCTDVGINKVALTVTDLAGNTSSDTALVTVEYAFLPSPSVTVAKDSVCNNQNITISFVNNIPSTTWTWTVASTGISGANDDNSGISSQVQQVLSNNSNSVQKVSYAIVPTLYGTCALPPLPANIWVAPDLEFALKTNSYTGGHNISCYGKTDGAIMVQDTMGGFGQYRYTWNNGNKTSSITNTGAGNYGVTVADMKGCSLSKSVILSQPSRLHTVTDELKNVTCSGGNSGTIKVTPLGGTIPYRFTWKRSGMSDMYTEDLESIYSGVYFLSLTDTNNCSFDTSYIVYQPKDITWNDGKINYGTYPNYYNISCKGKSDGGFSPSISPANPSYRFKWTRYGDTTTLANAKDVKGLKAGKYSLLVSDSLDCRTTLTSELIEPDSIRFTKSVFTYSNGFNIQCYGNANGKIDITNLSGGGIGPNHFIWTAPDGTSLSDMSSQGNLKAGKYKLTVHEEYYHLYEGLKICEVSDSTVLSEPSPVSIKDTIPLFSNKAIACNQGHTGSILLTVTGGTGGYLYHWNTGDGDGLIQGNKDQHNLSAGTYAVTVTHSGVCNKDTFFTLEQPGSIVLNQVNISQFGSFNTSCYGKNDGFILQASPSGGVSGFSYKWTTSDGKGLAPLLLNQSQLTAGHYTLEVKDANQCLYTKIFTLTQPDSVSIRLNSTPISCASGSDGKVDCSVTGGTPAYIFSWTGPSGFTASSASISDLGTEGKYTVRVTDSYGCTAFASDSVDAPSSLVIKPGFVSDYHGKNTSCFGSGDGIISLSVSGGRTPYTYKWITPDGSGLAPSNKDQTTLSAGTYSVTITDKGGCQGNTSITLTQPEQLSLSLQNKTDVLCHGFTTGKIVVTGSGGILPYTYAWSGGQNTSVIDKLKAGDYMVTFSDVNSCQVSQVFTIEEPDAILITPTLVKPYCPDATDGEITLQINGGMNPYSILWDTDETSPGLDHLRPAVYVCRITDMNSCVIRDTIDLQPRYSACVEIPSAFSPNGDQVNDAWEITAGDPNNPVYVRDMYPSAVMEVYTRWGTLVYRSESGYPVPWDGNFYGRPLPLDSYYYVFDPKNGKRPLKGIVTIVK